MKNKQATSLEAMATADASTVATDFSFVDAMDIESQEPASLSLSVTPRHEAIGLNNKIPSTQVCATVKARELPEGNRAPVDIIVALDCSGSMNGSKLKQCKKTLELLLRVLLPSDRFGLISFASEAIIEIPAQPMTANNKKEALKKIKSLYTRGSTNISAAICLAAQEMRALEEPNEVRSIFLLTDGHANQGISDVAGVIEVTKNCLVDGHLVDLAEVTSSSYQVIYPQVIDTIDTMAFSQQVQPEPPKKRGFGSIFGKKKSEGSSSPPPFTTKAPEESSKAKAPPTTLHCFGYGRDHDSDFLRKVASATPGGTYYFVQSDCNVGSAFGDALGGILSVVAQSAVVNIQVAPQASDLGVEIVDVFHPQKLKRANGTYSVTLGDFYAEESRDLLFEVKLAIPKGHADWTPIPHASITLAYTDAIQKRPMETGPVVSSIIRPPGSELSESNHHVVVQWLRIYATREIAQAEEMGRNKDLASARTKIQNAQRTIRSAPNVQGDPLVEQLLEDLNRVSHGLSSQYEWDSRGAHTMQQTFQSHTMQRCAEDTHATRSVYRGSHKAKWSKAFTLH